MLRHCRCLGVSGSSVLLPTLDYFVKSSAELNVESLMLAGSDVSSPREREQFNRLISPFTGHSFIYSSAFTCLIFGTVDTDSTLLLSSLEVSLVTGFGRRLIIVLLSLFMLCASILRTVDYYTNRGSHVLAVLLISLKCLTWLIIGSYLTSYWMIALIVRLCAH